MKKRNSIICVLLVIAMAVCGQVNAKSMDDVVGTYYNMKFQDKYWMRRVIP